SVTTGNYTYTANVANTLVYKEKGAFVSAAARASIGAVAFVGPFAVATASVSAALAGSAVTGTYTLAATATNNFSYDETGNFTNLAVAAAGNGFGLGVATNRVDGNYHLGQGAADTLTYNEAGSFATLAG